MKEMPLLTIVSMGDAAGIGWEILLQVLADKSKNFRESELKKLSSLLVVGDLFEHQSKQVSAVFDVQPFPENPDEILPWLQKRRSSKPVFFYLQKAKKYEPGKPNSALALRSYRYFQKAVQLWKAFPSALVTLPLSKEYIMKAGVAFAGHTEVLQEVMGTTAYMCMYHKKLSVLPLTHHIPLARVPDRIAAVDFDNLGRALFFFLHLLGDKRPMAMVGLNPHAGENGKIGSEEDFLRLKLKALQAAGLPLEGIFAADGFFSPTVRKNFSLVLTNYHDQGLIPFKALFGAAGLNITLNMPRLRVSPAHGPAYDIAGKNQADPESVITSLRFAFQWGQKWMDLYSSLS